jgi:hypothetical protein
MNKVSSISRIALRQLAFALFFAANYPHSPICNEPGVHVVVAERATEPGGRHMTRDLNGVLSTARI